MRLQLLSLVATASVVSAQSAPVVEANPAGAKYVATLPSKEGSSLSGSITAQSATDGKGVTYAVSIAGLPEEGGPFSYHVHAQPVPADGNCTGTGAHLDPYNRGEDPPCDADKPETCQTGDLAGKYGKMTEQEWSQEYTDLYTATDMADPSYIGNLSIVVHLSNKTRIACANFEKQGGGSVGTSSGYAMPSGTGTGGYNNSTMTTTPTGQSSGVTGSPISPTLPVQTDNSAAQVASGAGAMFAAVAAFIL